MALWHFLSVLHFLQLVESEENSPSYGRHISGQAASAMADFAASPKTLWWSKNSITLRAVGARRAYTRPWG